MYFDFGPICFGVGIGTAVLPPLGLKVGVGIGTGVYLGDGIVLFIDGPEPTLRTASFALSRTEAITEGFTVSIEGLFNKASGIFGKGPVFCSIRFTTASKLDLAFAGDGKGVDFFAILVTEWVYFSWLF